MSKYYRVIVMDTSYSSAIIKVEDGEDPIDVAHSVDYWDDLVGSDEKVVETVYKDDQGEFGPIEIFEIDESFELGKEPYDLTRHDGELFWSEYF